MALVVTNHEAATLAPADRQQAYNCLDVCLTLGIAQMLLPQFSNKRPSTLTYAFERALQGPALTMAVRGIAVDESARSIEGGRLLNAEANTIRRLRTLANVWLDAGSTDFNFIRSGLCRNSTDGGLNPYGHSHVRRLLYEACGEAAYHKRASGSPTTDDCALRMLIARSPVVGVMARLILQAREIKRWRNIVNSARPSRDGRLRCSFSIGASASGCWSTSLSSLEEGMNFYAVPLRSRSFLVPSAPDRIMILATLRNAEALVAARLAGDDAYAAAVLTGGPRNDPIELETLHGTGERRLSKMTGAPIGTIKTFQQRFFAAYPKMKERIKNARGRRWVVSPVGRWHRHLGFPDEADTTRGSLADEVRGTVSDITSIALWRLWHRHEIAGNQPSPLHILSRDNDSILLECRADDLGAVHEAVAEAFASEFSPIGRVPITIGIGRSWREAGENSA